MSRYHSEPTEACQVIVGLSFFWLFVMFVVVPVVMNWFR